MVSILAQTVRLAHKPRKAESAGNAKAFQQVLLFFVHENIQANTSI